MNNMPKVYFQFKKLRAMWVKSKSESKHEMIALFDEYISNLEKEYAIDEALLETLDTFQEFK